MKTAKARTDLKAPFPAFGGKRKVADLVWSRFGDPRNFIEPFCRSAAILLCRPTEPKIETLNDLEPYIANFWRAVKVDPEAVAVHADHPVVETDMHARHRWLMFSEESSAALRRVKSDPDYFDARVAGWWCWGACCWIGSGWCETPNSIAMPSPGQWQGGCVPEATAKADARRPYTTHQKRPRAHRENSGDGWMPGVLGRPQLADAYSRGRGVNGNDHAGSCVERLAWLTDWMLRLADRLRPVRVCCGHWRRVCDSPSTTTRLGLTAVFLDPPYRVSINGKANRSDGLYANDKQQDVNALCDEVQAWAVDRGTDPEMRIAVCGLEGEYPDLDAAGWDCVPWKAVGGYGNQSGKVNDNAHRERIWFSPACLKPRRERGLFDGV